MNREEKLARLIAEGMRRCDVEHCLTVLELHGPGGVDTQRAEKILQMLCQ